MKFEDILTEINGFGKFQLMIVLLQSISRITLPCHFLLNNFIAAVPSHHCNVEALDDGDVFASLTQQQRLTVHVPTQEDGTPSSCQMFPEPQFHLLVNSSNATETPAVMCQNGWVYDKSNFASTIVTEWDLVCESKGMNRITATIFFVGVMCGAPVFGILSDRFGRKTMLLVSYLSAITFALASAFSTSYLMFAIMRFFTGFCMTGLSITSYALNVEWFSVEHRTFAGVIVSLDWTLGNVLLAGFAYFVNTWRWLLVAVTSPLFLGVIAWWWLPESARWLIANGKFDKAHMYMEKCAKMNNRLEFVSEMKPETLSNVCSEEKTNRKYSFLDLVRTPKMRKLASITGIVWFGVAFTYYGISLNIAGFGPNIYLTQLIYASIEIPSKIGIFYSLNKLGRRKSQSGTLALTGVCIVINIFAPQGLWVFRTIVAVLGKGLSECAFTTVYLYTCELFPTVVRQNGLGYNSVLGRLGVSIAPLVMLLEDVWKLLPQVLFCTVAIFSGMAALLLPETQNVCLPETIEDIEQPRKRCVTPSTQEKFIPKQKQLITDGDEKGS